MKTELTEEMRDRLVSSVCKIYGDNLLSIILYGSVARNSATDDSDIDIAFIVTRDEAEMHDKLLDVIVDLNLEYDQLISPSMIEIDIYNKWRKVLPYYKNIENEGVVLWKGVNFTINRLLFSVFTMLSRLFETDA